MHLPLPLTRMVVRSLLGKPDAIDPSITDPVMRRMMLVRGYVLPVNFNMPPPARQDGVLGRMNGFAVGRRNKRVAKETDDVAARRRILAGMPVTRDGGETKKDRKMAKDVAKGKDRKLKRKVDDDNRKEHRANENLVWLVIINEADGEFLAPTHWIIAQDTHYYSIDIKIQGKEAVDNSSNHITLDDKHLEYSRRMHDEEREYY